MLFLQPHIRIWNSISLATLKIIGIGDFDRAVACIAFSKMASSFYFILSIMHFIVSFSLLLYKHSARLRCCSVPQPSRSCF